MDFLKRKGHIFDVRLNASEARALEDYCNKVLQEKAKEWEEKFNEKIKMFERTKTQFAQDAAIITLHKQFGFGPERQVKFNLHFVETINELGELLLSDEKDDPSLVYTKTKVDRLIFDALGPKYFAPWEIRYNEIPLKDADPNTVGSAFSFSD